MDGALISSSIYYFADISSFLFTLSKLGKKKYNLEI